MKKVISFLSLCFALVIWTSCSSREGNMAHMNEMKDSIFAAYPTIAAVTINVQNDNHLLITLGSQDLYERDAVDKKQVANEMAAMAMRIFGKDNHIKTGKIIVTANETNQDPEPVDGISADMDIKAVSEN